MLSKPEQDEDVASSEFELSETDVLIDDYKDLEIEMMTGSRAKTLWWMKDYE